MEKILDYLDNAKSRLVQHQGREYHINGRKFKTTTELDKFCDNEGIDPSKLAAHPKIKDPVSGKIIIELK